MEKVRVGIAHRANVDRRRCNLARLPSSFDDLTQMPIMRAHRTSSIRLEVVEDRLAPATLFHETSLMPSLESLRVEIVRPQNATVARLDVVEPDRPAFDHFQIDVRGTPPRGEPLSLRDPSSDASSLPMTPRQFLTDAAQQRDDESSSSPIDFDHHFLSHDRLVGLPPVGEVDGNRQAQSQSSSRSSTDGADDEAVSRTPGAAATVKMEAATEGNLGAAAHVVYRFSPAQPESTTAIVEAPSGDAVVASPVMPETVGPSTQPPAIEAEETPVEAFFPMGAPISGILSQNLSEIEASVTTILAELPEAGSDLIDALGEQELYSWLSASILLATTAVVVARSRRSRTADRVLVGTDSVRVRPEERLRVSRITT